MIVFTSHFPPRSAPGGDAIPVLVREGFSWPAAIFGAWWLASWRAWVPALLSFAALLATAALGRMVWSGAPLLGFVVLQGLLGPELLRWHFGVRGYREGPVVAASGYDEALARLIDARPGQLDAEALSSASARA